MAEARRILITAGPTHEAIDRVRYLANRSSGRVGIALAEAGAAAGAQVTLLLGPVADVEGIRALTAPSLRSDPACVNGVRVMRFVSAGDLEKLLAIEWPRHDVLIMAAAVADYRPIMAMTDKIERTGERMTLELEPVPDLVAGCARCKRADQRIVAFALEKPDVMLDRAAAKLRRKGVDAIVANPLQTMGADTITATLITATGEQLTPGGDGSDPCGRGTGGDAGDDAGGDTGGGVAKSTFAHWLIEWVLTSG